MVFVSTLTTAKISYNQRRIAALQPFNDDVDWLLWPM